MSTTEQTTDDEAEARFATRARLEAAARWLEQRAHLARKNGDDRAAVRYHDNAMRALVSSRQPSTLSSHEIGLAVLLMAPDDGEHLG
jgi:hypothetical protein